MTYCLYLYMLYVPVFWPTCVDVDALDDGKKYDRKDECSTASFVESHLVQFTASNNSDPADLNAINDSLPEPDTSIYEARNVQINDGILQLLSGPLRIRSSTGCSLARIDTAKHLDMRYGYVEWSMRFQKVPGLVYWLRLEQYKCSDDERIDGKICRFPQIPAILFSFNRLQDQNGRLGVIYAELWSRLSPNAHEVVPVYYTTSDVLDDHDDQYHVYRIVWSKDCVAWFVDGAEIGRYLKASQIPNAPMYMSVSTQSFVQSNCPADRLDVRMDIRYIHIGHQNSSQHNEPAATSPVQNLAISDVVPHSLSRTKDDNEAPAETLSRSEYIWIITAASLLAVIFVVVISWVLIRKRRNGRLSGTMRTVQFGTGGISHPNRYIPLISRVNKRTAFLVNTGCKQRDALIAKSLQILDVPAEKLDISSKVLGKGHFAIVRRGVAHDLRTANRGPTTVAVKSLLDTSDLGELKLFIAEFLVMVKLGRHVNIVGLLGTCQSPDQLQLVLEYCQFGSLLNYLRSHRLLASNERRIGHDLGLTRSSPTNVQNFDANGTFETDLAPFASINSDLEDQLTVEDLIQFCHQISRGMEYLCSRRVIHRDLAARNVLVASHKILKISDFGLAKHGHQEYLMLNANSVSMPVLWMPPESIISTIFSQKSDVWSFGVLLWEIFSMGKSPAELPYIPMSSSTVFAAWLTAGNRMEHAPHAPQAIHEMMQSCWDKDPTNRPTFAQLRDELDNLIQCAVDSPIYLLLDEAVEEFNALHRDVLDGLMETDLSG